MIRLFLVSLVASQVLGFDNPILVDLSNLSENVTKILIVRYLMMVWTFFHNYIVR